MCAFIFSWPVLIVNSEISHKYRLLIQVIVIMSRMRKWEQNSTQLFGDYAMNELNLLQWLLYKYIFI